MKAEKLKELKAKNVLVENIFEKMRDEAQTEQERKSLISSLERVKELCISVVVSIVVFACQMKDTKDIIKF